MPLRDGKGSEGPIGSRSLCCASLVACRPALNRARCREFSTYNREEFPKHYPQLSNVETTFSMIKAKLGSRVRPTTTAQVNEVLAKVLCHNLCCLVSAFFELGIDPKSWYMESVA